MWKRTSSDILRYMENLKTAKHSETTIEHNIAQYMGCLNVPYRSISFCLGVWY